MQSDLEITNIQIKQAVKERLNNHVKKRIICENEVDEPSRNPPIVNLAPVPSQSSRKPKRKNKKRVETNCDLTPTSGENLSNSTESEPSMSLIPGLIYAETERFEPEVASVLNEHGAYNHANILNEILSAKKLQLMQNPEVIRFFQKKTNQ